MIQTGKTKFNTLKVRQIIFIGDFAKFYYDLGKYPY